MSGKLRARFDLAADVLDLALSPSLVAVLVRERSVTRIEVRDARTGALRRSLRAPKSTRSIQIAGRTVLFNYTLLDAVSGRSVPVPEEAAGSVISGRRLAWAEVLQVGGRYETRIRVLALPARW